MKRALGACALAGLLALAFWARRAAFPAPLGAEVAYLARAVELALAGDVPAGRDRYLAHPEGAPPPCSPELSTALAALARTTCKPGREPASPELLATGGVAEGDLERLLLCLAPLGGLAAGLAAYLAARAIAPHSPAPALAAAAAAAALPAALLAERAGETVAEPWAALAIYLECRWIAAAAGGRDLSAATLGGMLAGAAGALAVLLSSSAAPLALGGGIWLAARAARAAPERRADGWRALAMFALVLVAVLAVAPAGEAALLGRIASGMRTAGWWARALAPLAALAVGLACAGRGRRLPSAGAAVVLIAALAVLGAPLRGAAAGGSEARRAIASGMRWLRDHSPSPGPFNQAGASADWCVLTAPEWGAAVAYHARRPAVAARFPSVGGPPALARARAALAVSDAPALSAALCELGASYVVVSPLMARAPSIAGLPMESAFGRLAFPATRQDSDFASALELVHASDLWITAEGLPVVSGSDSTPSGPAVSIYRATAPARAVPQASSAR
jgi:hypothetical protein